jgi:hypothetical protein
MYQLVGDQLEEFHRLVSDAFSRSEFRKLLLFRLNRDIDLLYNSGEPSNDILNLLIRANQEGWCLRLIGEVKRARPLREDIQEFTPTLPILCGDSLTLDQAESIVDLSNPMLDARSWTARLQQTLPRVCRIEIAGQAYGTGALVGPRDVLTAYHVIKSLIEPLGAPARHSGDLIARFDYMTSSGGQPAQGTECRLTDSDWLAASSPHGKLDYAILRLSAAPPGDRGYLPRATSAPPPRAPLYIVHHPDGRPLCLSLASQAVIRTSPDKVWYRTNTLGGSSGSPCFAANWEPVALHVQGGGMENSGILLRAIIEHAGPAWPLF